MVVVFVGCGFIKGVVLCYVVVIVVLRVLVGRIVRV